MVLITESGPETLGINEPAPDFTLPATDGQTYSLASFSGKKVSDFAQVYGTGTGTGAVRVHSLLLNKERTTGDNISSFHSLPSFPTFLPLSPSPCFFLPFSS